MIIKKLPLLYYLLVFSPCVLYAQINKENCPNFEQHIFYYNGQFLKFQLLRPQKIEADHQYPLLLFLHGAGSRGDDNNMPKTHIAPLLTRQNLNKYPCFVLIPQCPKAYRWVETDWTLPTHTQPDKASVPMQLVEQLLLHTKKTHPIDTQRIYLTGLSMGGFGCWDLLARQPHTFAAAAPICGGADLETAPLIKHIPIWCFHGGNDRLVLTQRSRDMVSVLKKLDADIKYTEYKGVGHGSWKPAYQEPEFLSWLFSHIKN